MEKLTQEAEAILFERFGGDSVISLATQDGGVPYVRYVNAFYKDGAFYVLTHGLSQKMRQIAKNPTVAIAGDWFTAHGRGESLGWFGKADNRDLADKMRTVFAGWIDNGHSDLTDENTCILQIRLTSGVLFSHGRRFDIDFTA